MDSQPAPIVVTFVDSVRHVTADEPEGLAFGRGAALDVDSNPFMHRQVGRFVPLAGIWWVENLSAWSPLWVTAAGTTHLVDGGAKVALCEEQSTVSFEAGVGRYELHVHLSEVPAAPPVVKPPDDVTLTQPRDVIVLTDEERLMVVALAEPILRDPPTNLSIPTNREVRVRLGWTTAKFNRKLDYLCTRLFRLGVEGVRLPDRRARDRRRYVIDHLISENLITTADLPLLDAYPVRPEEA